MNENLRHLSHETDVCVVGGGMAGLIAAVSAARHGAKVMVMQDRPVLGGNASSEVRMWIRGAHGKENRETGLLQEIELENIYRNPTMNPSVWDSVLFQIAAQEKNLTVLMNCSCLDLAMDGDRIASVTGWQLTSYTFHTVSAKVFLDCSGDSILAPLSGAEYRVGREGRGEHGEYGAEVLPDRKTMGNTCLIQAREGDRPCAFTPPPWAHVYPTDESMHMKNHDFVGTGVNFWWIELGGEEDTIADAESIRTELLKTAFGVWDHIKNHGDHGVDNWELEWIGFLPGKRESRRYIGDVILNQRDLEEGTEWADVAAFGGWTMDNHAPEGFRYPGYSSHHITPKVPYRIPYRALYSRNIGNLMFAGRNISATHMAMSSTRVMATCAVVGQAAGTAAAIAVRQGQSPRGVGQEHIALLQQMLLDDGCFLPGKTRAMPEAMRGATLSLPEAEAAVLQNGRERPSAGDTNSVAFRAGDLLALTLARPVTGASLRIALDPDFSRESISKHVKYQTFAMRTHIAKDDEPLKMPAALARRFTVTAWTQSGAECTVTCDENHKALVFIPLPDETVRVSIRFDAAWQGDTVHVFSCDIG